MRPIAIQPITKPVHMHTSGDTVVLPETLRRDVDSYWQLRVDENPRLRNGEVFTVTAVDETDDRLDITLAETDYAHYLYSYAVGDLGAFTVRIVHSATLVVTADNKLVFGAMGEHTSRPGVIQCCGGGIDNRDITDGIVDIEHNTVNELAEELGIDAHEANTVDSFYPAYLKTGGLTEKMTLAYILRLKLQHSEFLEQYDAFAASVREAGQEPEFGQLYCMDRDAESVERLIAQEGSRLNEYMPALLRSAVFMV